MVHIKLLKKKEDKYIEHCPYHRICFAWFTDETSLETFLEERIKKKYKNIPPVHQVWDFENYYIGQLLLFIF